MKYITNSAKETFTLGREMGKKIKRRKIIGLIGDLGAGKTVFTQGLAVGLGVRLKVTSPTFVIMKIYPVKSAIKSSIKQLVHIDAYRLKKNDWQSIGAEDYWNRPKTVTLIEWADRIKPLLPPETIFVKIQIKEGNKRIINIQNL